MKTTTIFVGHFRPQPFNGEEVLARTPLRGFVAVLIQPLTVVYGNGHLSLM